MVFYEITAEIRNLEELMPETIDTDRKARLWASGFDAPARRAFEESGETCCVFLKFVTMSTGASVLGGIAPDRAALEGQLQSFFRYAGIRADDIRMTEVTMRVLWELLRSASRAGYIEDSDTYLEAFELDDFIRNATRCFDYSEKLLSREPGKKQLREKARQLACEDKMLPELERIFRGPTRSVIQGHPVHYQICADDGDAGVEMAELLLTALLQGDRIRNHRLGSLRCGVQTEDNLEYLEMAYRLCDGGALLIDMHELAEGLNEGTAARGSAEAITTVCDCLKKYRNSVLTVLLIPRTVTGCRELLRENLGSISLVELEEDLMFGERSRRFLRSLAKEKGVSAPGSLMRQLSDPEKGWLPGDLRAAFDRWFCTYLRENVYPQYAAFAPSVQEAARAKPKGSAISELEGMVGLKDAKEVIGQALDYYKAQKLFRDRGRSQDAPAMHMVFTGNPGTAKTTVARLFARIMKENGILSQGNLIEVGRGDLVGKYVGWTAPAVQKKFRAAKGGVLFIDEAYSLLDGHENSYGDEAINTIVQEMENCRDSTVVIFAGYPGPMEEFLARNPGLRSRIAFQVPFEDYSEEELYTIAETMAAARGLSLAPGVRDKLLPIIREGMRTPDFGNGRFARSLVEKAAMRQGSRLVRGDVVNVTDLELQTLLPEDFVMPQLPREPARKVIGFSLE